MTQEEKSHRRLRIPVWLVVGAASALTLPLLMALAYRLDLASYPATWWRDHPFDYANMLHLADTFSWSARLWAWDPLHLFGWTPHVFYNPLATLLAAIFCWPLGYTPGAYKLWLFFLLWLTSFAGYLLLPRRLPAWTRACGGVLFAWASLLVYPGDVGILDANPAQVLYTGQWAQRLGIYFGIAALAVWAAIWRHETGTGEIRLCRWRTIFLSASVGMLAGAAIFSHYMSGYAAFVAVGLFCLWKPLAVRLADGRWQWKPLLLFPLVATACLLLWADFFYPFLSLNAEYHSLPLLRWQVPEGAHLLVREPVLAFFPVLLLPLLGLPGNIRNRPVLVNALFPLAVFAVAATVSVSWLLPGLLLVMLVSLAAARLSGRAELRHFLPVAATGLWMLACGPESLRFGSLDLSAVVPFTSQLGWAKLAAFSRWLWLGWLGLVAAHALSRSRGRIRAAAIALLAAGFVFPLVLSLSSSKGAQTFFSWMNQTDHDKTGALLGRMQEVAGRTPADGYLLVEDTLHHGEDSLLGGSGIPFGHLPYLVARRAGRPVLGAAVTTRYLTHPLAHTSRGKLLCASPQNRREFFEALDRLRRHGVSDVLVHSKAFVQAISDYENASKIDQELGLVHFKMLHYRPVVSQTTAISWQPDGLRFLPGGDRTTVSLQHVPFLDCHSGEEDGCEISAFETERLILHGCHGESEAEALQTSLSMMAVKTGRGSSQSWVSISSAVPLLPFLVMLVAWCLMPLAVVMMRRSEFNRKKQGDDG